MLGRPGLQKILESSDLRSVSATEES